MSLSFTNAPCHTYTHHYLPPPIRNAFPGHPRPPQVPVLATGPLNPKGQECSPSQTNGKPSVSLAPRSGIEQGHCQGLISPTETCSKRPAPCITVSHQLHLKAGHDRTSIRILSTLDLNLFLGDRSTFISTPPFFPINTLLHYCNWQDTWFKRNKQFSRVSFMVLVELTGALLLCFPYSFLNLECAGWNSICHLRPRGHPKDKILYEGGRD